MREPRTSGSRSAVWDLLLVFAAALLLRTVYLVEVWEIPFFENPIVDARSYDQWGQRIAEGSWLGDEVFYQAPAYPYFLGILYATVGRDLFSVHVVQMAIGALSCAILAAASRVLFGRAIGLVAGLLLAFYPVAWFFDGLIQKTVLATFFTTTLVLALALFQDRPRLRTACMAGAVLGLLALTRENALVFAAIVPAWMLLRSRDRPIRGRAAQAAAFAAGVLLVLTPVGVRNQWIGGTFALTTSQLGPNFYIGNNPDASGIYAPLLPGRHTPDFEGSDAALIASRELGRELDAGEVSSYWLGRSLRYIRDQPLAWALLVFDKVLLTANAFEIPDTEDVFVYAESSVGMRLLLPVLHFGTLLPFATAGMVLARREKTGALVLVLLAAGLAASVVAFYVFGRYRFPLVPLLTPFAALALVRGCQAAMARDYDAVLPAAVVGLLVAAVSNSSLLNEEKIHAGSYTNLGNIMLRKGAEAEAEAYLLRAVQLDDDTPDLQLHLALLRARQERWREAEEHLRHMLSLESDDHRGHVLMAQVLARQGRTEEARRHRAEAVRLNPERGGGALPLEGRDRAPPGDAGEPQ